VNWIDTAAAYGLGHSEEIVGRAIKGRRDQVYIATKCGLVWDDQGRVRNDIRPQSIRREVEASLSRLDIDVIDLYQIHWPYANHSETDAWREFVKLKKEGKVRWIGVSNFDVPLLQRCEKIEHIDSLQPPYSMLRRDIEKAILPYCQENNIGVIAYSPMFSGLLSGRFDRLALAHDDWRARNPMFNEPLLSKNLAFVQELKHIAAKYDCTVGKLAVAWVLHHPAITAAIVGARKVEQIEENVRAADVKLADKDLEMIENLLVKHNINALAH
jgi:aryl-alcohol dehydrogenase-like predicted oxidoreductase